ncbi:MAG: DUF72 domain-containing protein [Candidatus Njordarchaeia archaeon]|nr:DUF72 domain-containing protein [Candidatus Korarchaeota archaeon]
MPRIFIGVCSFSRKILKLLKTCEIQSTFYNFPKLTTVKKWKESAPKDFVFSFKVFQGITHSSSSPTWRKFRKGLSPEEKKLVGNLQLNELTQQYWEQTLDIAKILSPEILVIQTPPKFAPNEKNLKNAMSFFEFATTTVSKINAKIGWEPRGNWLNSRQHLQRIFETYSNLLEIVDPFFFSEIIIKDVVYYRLHGIPYLNYRYNYTENDFQELIQKITSRIDANVREIYIMFNTVSMIQDAINFISYIRENAPSISRYL